MRLIPRHSTIPCKNWMVCWGGGGDKENERVGDLGWFAGRIISQLEGQGGRHGRGVKFRTE